MDNMNHETSVGVDATLTMPSSEMIRRLCEIDVPPTVMDMMEHEFLQTILTEKINEDVNKLLANVEQVQVSPPVITTESELDEASNQMADARNADYEQLKYRRSRKRKHEAVEQDKPSPKKPKMSKPKTEQIDVTNNGSTTKSCWEKVRDFIGSFFYWRKGQRSPDIINNISKTFEDIDKDALLKYLEDVDGEKKDPGKGAMKLMNKLFTDDEMSSHCYKDVHGRCKKPDLDRDRVEVLEKCLKQHYGPDIYCANKSKINERCNQKCRVKAKKRKSD